MKNNNAVSEHHVDEEPTTGQTGKSGGRDGRAKNQTTIVRNETEKEGGSIGHTVKVKKVELQITEEMINEGVLIWAKENMQMTMKLQVLRLHKQKTMLW